MKVIYFTYSIVLEISRGFIIFLLIVFTLCMSYYLPLCALSLSPFPCHLRPKCFFHSENMPEEWVFPLLPSLKFHLT